MKKEMTYLDSVHRDGRIWNISVMIALFMYPILVGVLFGVLPDWHGLLMGLVATAPMYWAVAVVETFTYVPMLGAGGSYLSFVTGNISNLKLPVALNALEQAGANIRTEEGEIVSTIAIAVSSIVTTVIIILGVILITPLTPILDAPVLAPAFAQILPALFGGLGVVFVSKNWKIAVAPVILMLALFIFVPALNASTVGIMVPVGVRSFSSARRSSRRRTPDRRSLSLSISTATPLSPRLPSLSSAAPSLITIPRLRTTRSLKSSFPSFPCSSPTS